MEKKASAVPATIDAYLEQQPAPQRQTLEKVRRAIRSAAPKASEIISYQIPTFKAEYALISFAGFKNHCSIFTLSNEVMKVMAKELEAYDCKGVTIHFPVDKAPPAALIKKMVQLRLTEVAARATARDSIKKKK